MKRLLVPALVLLLAVPIIWAGHGIVEREIGDNPDTAADVLPIYLATAALASGGDPTSRGALMDAYEERGLTATAATFSNLYPATVGVVFWPLRDLGWPAFVEIWRWLLLAAAVAMGALGGLALPSRPGLRPLLVAGGVLYMLVFPATGTCVRLGQVNMLLALLAVGVMLALGRSRPHPAAALAAVGAAIKLVPAGFFFPLLAARRFRALAVGLLVWGLLFALAAVTVSPLAMLDGIRQSLAFQSSVQPDWAGLWTNPPMAVLLVGALRHEALMGITLALGGAAALTRPRPPVLVALTAMLAAWLGADASAFHVLYTPLFLPALLHVAAWPAERDAPPRLALAASLLALAVPLLLWWVELPGFVLEARMVLAGQLLWTLSLVRLGWAWWQVPDPVAPGVRRFLAVVGPVAGILVGLAVVDSLPRAGPQGAPIPPHVANPDGAGFIIPGAPVPGGGTVGGTTSPVLSSRFKGMWPEVPAGGTLRPGTGGAMAEHLERARELWERLEVLDPTAVPHARWVLEALPRRPIHDITAGELLKFLTRERVAILELGRQDPRLREIVESHREAMGEEGEHEPKRRSFRRERGSGAEPSAPR